MKCNLTYLSISQFPEENTQKYRSQKQLNMFFSIFQQDYCSHDTSQQSLHIQTVVVNAESFFFLAMVY